MAPLPDFRVRWGVREPGGRAAHLRPRPRRPDGAALLPGVLLQEIELLHAVGHRRLYDQRSRSSSPRDGAMGRLANLAVLFSLLPGAQRQGDLTLARCERAPQAVEETTAPLDDLLRLLGPVHVVKGRPDEEMEQSQPSAPTVS